MDYKLVPHKSEQFSAQTFVLDGVLICIHVIKIIETQVNSE